MSRDIPVIFKGAMVRAELAEEKTQTRRIFSTARYSPDLQNTPGYYRTGLIRTGDEIGYRGGLSYVEYRHERQDHPDYTGSPSPYYAKLKYSVGDRLWVRETVACGACAPSKPSCWAPSFWRREQGTPDNPSGLWYAADGLSPRDPLTDRGRWVPAIHMPRWVSRLTLVVSGLKVERIQDISDADAIAEGVFSYRDSWSEKQAAAAYLRGTEAAVETRNGTTAQRLFYLLWTDIHGKESWAANPEVVAISFRVIKANIDAPAARLAA